jgi:hypothetical protein
VDEQTLNWLDILGRALMWAAVIVLVFSVIGAITIGSSQSSLPLVEDVQRENRGTIALAALGGGIASAGVLAGLGAIVRLLVADRRQRG